MLALETVCANNRILALHMLTLHTYMLLSNIQQMAVHVHCILLRSRFSLAKESLIGLSYTWSSPTLCGVSPCKKLLLYQLTNASILYIYTSPLSGWAEIGSPVHQQLCRITRDCVPHLCVMFVSVSIVQSRYYTHLIVSLVFT